MILVDPRSGSAELLPKFKNIKIPVQLSSCEMLAGDFCFEGNGPGQTRILVGVERKTIKDLMNCIRTERFSGHQIKVLLKPDGMYDRVYVMVEGQHRCAADGLLEEPRGGSWVPVKTGSIRYMFSQLDNFITSIEEFTPIRFHFSKDAQDTANRIANLYRFWNDKEYERHTAIDGHQATRVEVGKKWTFPRVVASELPGVGQDSARAVARWFGDLNSMMEASVDQWAEVEVPYGKRTKRIGQTIAQRIFNKLREEEL